jgi:hypothetical protein
MSFDPDAYLGDAPASFDPDAYLKGADEPEISAKEKLRRLGVGDYTLGNLVDGLDRVIRDPRGAASLPRRLDESIQASFADDARAPVPSVPVLEQRGGTVEQIGRGVFNTLGGLVNALPTAGTVAALNPIGAPIVGADMLYHAFKGAPDAGRAVVDPNVSTQQATEQVLGTVLQALPLAGLKALDRGKAKPVEKPAERPGAAPEKTAAENRAAEIEAARAFDPDTYLAETKPTQEPAGTPAAASAAVEAGGLTNASRTSTPGSPLTQPLPERQTSATTLPSTSTARTNPAEVVAGGSKSRALGSIDEKTTKRVIQPENDVKTLLERAAAARPALETRLQEVAAEIPGVQFLASRVKEDGPRLREKLAAGRPADTVSDYLGARLAVDDLPQAEALVKRFGADVLENENFLESPKAGYRAWHLQLMTPDGVSVEVQMIPREIAAAQAKAHKAYELARAGDVSVEVARRARDLSRQIFDEAWDKFKTRTGRQVEPTPAVTPGEAAPAAKPFTATTPKGDAQVSGTWELVDAGQLKTSQDAGYAAELQPRDRSRAASEQQIADIVRRLNPELLGDSLTTDTGAPIIDGARQVLSGNGRTLALRDAYAAGEPGAKYRAWLEQAAPQFGIPVDRVRSMERPMLVRQVAELGEMKPAEFARASNDSTKLGYSDSEKAAVDAARLRDTAGLLDQFRPSPEGDVLAATNRDFLNSFIDATGDRAELVNVRGDGYNEARLGARVRAAVVGALIGPENRPVLDALIEAPEGIKRVGNAVLVKSGRLLRLQGTPFDVGPAMARALGDTISLKRKGETVENYLAQTDMFGDSGRTSASDTLVRAFEELKSTTKINDFFDAFADLVAKQDPNTPDMFGTAPRTAAELLNHAREAAVRGGEVQQAIFARRRPQEWTEARARLEQVRAKWRVSAERIAPGLMERFKLEFGEPEQLVKMGRAEKRSLTGHEEAAYLAHERILFLFDQALQKRSDMGTTINFLHEAGHAFFDALPGKRQAEVLDLWQREVAAKKGPLYARGELKRGVARGVEDSVKEFFAERMAWANHEWAARRAKGGVPEASVGAGLFGRVAQQFRQLLARLGEYVSGLRARKIDTDFRTFLDQGKRFEEVPAGVGGLELAPAFAKRRGAGVGVDRTADLFDTGENFNLFSEAQKDQAPLLEAKRAAREEAAKQATLFDQGPAEALFATRDAGVWLERNFTSAGGMPKEAFARKLARDGRLAAIAKQSEFALRDFDRAVRTVYGGYRAMTPAELARVNDVLGGKVPLAALDPRLQGPVGTMRNQIDTLSRRLVREGAISGEVAARVSGNIGFYLNRSYRKFDDPKWAQRVPEAVRNRAESFIAAELQAKQPLLPVDPAQVRGYADYLLSKDAAETADFYQAPREGAKDLRVFVKRQDIPAELRALMGEYTDPRVNYLKSVAKTSQVLEAHAFLGDVRTAGVRGGWLHDAPRTDATGAYVVPIAAKGSEALAPLNGLYTTKEIARAFASEMAPADHAWRWWLRANGWAKVAKTAFSPMTQIRNVAGNLGFLVANGHWRVDAAADVWRSLRADLGVADTPATRAYATKLRRLGVLGESVNFGELREAMRDAGARMTGIEEFTDSRLMKVAKAPFGAALRIYRTTDEVFKIYGFENERRAWAAADPTLRPEQLDAIAAERVRNTFPTYSMIPRAAQLVRRVGLTGSFLSWPSEIIRTGYHTIGYALRDLANANPRIKAMGAKRLAGIATMATAPYAASKVSQWLAGVDAKDDEQLRRFMPEWNQNATLLQLGHDGRGRYRMVDGSYLDPYSYLKKPITAALRGENWLEALQGAAWESMAPFASEGLLTQGLVDLARNRDASGRAVFNPQAPFLDQANEKVSHLWKVFEPGFVTQARRIVKGARGEVSPSGRAYDVGDEAQAVLTGARTQSIDVVQGMVHRAKRFAAERQGAEVIYTQVRDNRGTVEPGAKDEARAKMEQARARLYAGVSQDAKAALQLGATQGEVVQAMLAAGLSSTDAALVLTGRYLPFYDRAPSRARVMGEALRRR